MIEVRESMAHLFGLGLYQDVQVDAIAAQGDGVVLTYNLFPAQRVRRIAFEGSIGASRERFEAHDRGASRRVPVVRAIGAGGGHRSQALYRERGYPKAEIAVRTGNDADPSNMSMVFSIRPGPRARISAIEVQGTPRDPAPQVLNALNLRVGDEYDGVEIDRRLVRYADELRAQGYYEARVAHFPRYADGDAAVNLVLTIDPGPRVEIVFQGDPLACDRSRSARADRAGALRRRRPARGLEVRHRATLSRARLLQSARRLRADECRGGEAWCSRRRASRDVHHHPGTPVHGRAGRGDRQYRDSVSGARAARADEGRAAVQRFHDRLRRLANTGVLPSARILGGEGDVAGRTARAEGRQRVRARQAGDCRRCALGYRLGEFSGEYSDRVRRHCGAP